MANPVLQLLGENFTHTFYPRVSGTPKLVITQITFSPGKAGALKELLYEQLPGYWASAGLIDCKMLFSIHSRTVVLIESWEKPGDAYSYRQSIPWQNFLSRLEALKAEVKTIINDSFELIE